MTTECASEISQRWTGAAFEFAICGRFFCLLFLAKKKKHEQVHAAVGQRSTRRQARSVMQARRMRFETPAPRPAIQKQFSANSDIR